MDLLLFNTVLQLLWYISISIFFLHKYASQAHGIVKFLWTMCRSVGWLAQKTVYFIRGSPHEYESLITTETNTESKWSKWWNKTKTFFGLKQTHHLPTNVYVTNVSNSNSLGVSSELENSVSLEQQIFNKRLKSLINEDLNRSELPYSHDIEMCNSSLSENCEPVTVASYHPEQNIFNTPRPFTQNSMYYSINLNQSPRNI